FSDPHVQLPLWRERPLRDFGPLRALATVELWKGRGRDYDGALATLRQIVRDADALRADLAVCTGDLTQLAMEEEFALAQDALAPAARGAKAAGSYPGGGRDPLRPHPRALPARERDLRRIFHTARRRGVLVDRARRGTRREGDPDPAGSAYDGRACARTASVI